MKTNYTIDLLRGIAIILVILVHTFAYYFHYATEIIFYIPVVDHIARSGVPIFIFISGFVLSLKYWDNFKVKTFYKKRFLKILPPYLFFCFVYVVIPRLIDGMPIDFTFEDFLNIFFDPFRIFYHFWYIGVIISIYLFYPLLLKIFKRFKDHLFYALLASIFIQIIYNIFLPSIIDALEPLRNLYILYKFLFWFLFYIFLRYIAFFVLGVYISRNYDRIRLKVKYLYISIIPVITLIIMGEFINKFALEPFFSISIIVFFLSLLINKRSIFLEEVSKYSYGIYLIHALILFYIGNTLIQYSNYWFFYVYTFILTLSISFIIIYGLSKIPKSHFILGYSLTRE